MTLDGEELPTVLKSEHFARLMGWATTPSGLRRARRWLDRNRIGRRSGREVEWTISDLRSQAPSIIDELIDRGRLEH